MSPAASRDVGFRLMSATLESAVPKSMQPIQLLFLGLSSKDIIPPSLHRNGTPYTSLQLDFTTQNDDLLGPQRAHHRRLEHADALAGDGIMGLMKLGIEHGRTS